MLRYTVKPELKTIKDSRGKCAVYIKITCQRKRIRISTGVAVTPVQWDKGKLKVKSPSSNAAAMNRIIQNKVNDIETYIYEQQVKGISPELKSIKTKVSGKGSVDYTISLFVEELIEQMSGRMASGTLVNYRNECKRIEKYDPGATFTSVNHKWLKGYEQHLHEQGYAQNTIHKSFKTLTKFFNAAIKDDVTANYPFKVFDKPKYRQTDRTYLSASEVERIEDNLKLPMDDRLRRAAVWFLFGCYSGLRFSDWRRFEYKTMVRGKDIVIRAKKNGQLVVMPIHSKLRSVLKLLKEVGPVEAEPTTNLLLKGLAKLCGIEKNLTTHVARHSFAVRCAELGISIETCSELMGINVKTCQVYYKVTGTKVRNEMKKWG